MSVLAGIARVALRVTALPLVATKDVVDSIKLHDKLPLTADVVDEVFDSLERVFDSVEDAIDNNLE